MLLKKSLGLVIATSLLGVAVACSSTTETPDGGTGDGGTVEPTTDSGTDSGRRDGGRDSGTSDGGEDRDDQTVGKVCSVDTDCELGFGEADDKFCSKTAFTSGDTVNPTAVCLGACPRPTGDSLTPCDDGQGICLSTGTAGICFPYCQVAAGGAPQGCVGKNKCNAIGFGVVQGTVTAVGYCFGGCTSDADCENGDKCQKEDGTCSKPANLVTYTKQVGDTCTRPATGSSTECNCLALGAGQAGVCGHYCLTGTADDAGIAGGGCPTGFICNGSFPKTSSTGTALFATQPAGVSGNCEKACNVDGDCPANSICEESSAGKSCQVGQRAANDGG